MVGAGGESKSWLPGFHDPCEGEAKQLRVLYRFASKLHEVVVGDHDDLRLPLRGTWGCTAARPHALTPSRTARCWQRTCCPTSRPQSAT